MLMMLPFLRQTGEEVWPERGSCWKRSWHGSSSCLKLAVNLQEEGPGGVVNSRQIITLVVYMHVTLAVKCM